MEVKVIRSWKDQVAYSPSDPQHTLLTGSEGYRAVLVGLEAGQSIAPHPSTAAVYHFLEGTGWMNVDGKRLAVEPGATVVVPAGASRGVEAETRLAFLGSHGAKNPLKSIRLPTWMFGVMGLFALLIMIGFMLIGSSPMALMFSSLGSMGIGVWGTMILPFVGLLGMLVMMVFMFRTARAGGGRMAEHHHKHEAMMAKKSNTENLDSPSTKAAMHTISLTIPAISCGHCKETIERAVSKIPGVASAQVEVEARQAHIRYDEPATPAGIEAVLSEIGYPPDSQ
jgi:copper chaperone